MPELRSTAKKLVPHKMKNLIYLYCRKPLPMNWTDEEREKGLAKLYQRKTGKELDWNNLYLFTEKLQWYKLYYYHPDLSRIVDKYKFKGYIHEKLGEGYTVPLIGAWTDVDDIPWDKLPNTFVFKSNCQSDGKNILIIKDKKKENFDDLKNTLKQWLKPKNTLLHSYCRAYFDVTPMILAEEYIEQIDGQVYDFKFFCMNGKPICFKIDFDRFTGHRANYYDRSMNYLPISEEVCPPDPNFSISIDASVLDQMFSIAENLSTEFPFVRVDFYYVCNKIMLSEMTFYPGGGFNGFSMKTDIEWGEKFQLPPKSKLGRKFRTDLNYLYDTSI